MKVGLIADSLGDIDALERASQLLLAEKGAAKLFFLGGRYKDVDELVARMRVAKRGREEYTDIDFLVDVFAYVAKAAHAEAGGAAHKLPTGPIETFLGRLARVPERGCLQYQDPSSPHALIEMVGDKLACLVHDKADLTRDDIVTATFLVHGKSREPGVVCIGPRVFVTPGRWVGTGRRPARCWSWTASAPSSSRWRWTARSCRACPSSFRRGTS